MRRPRSTSASARALAPALILAVALGGLTACNRAGASGAAGGGGCEALETERVALNGILTQLETTVAALPADATRYAENTRETLLRFNELLRESNARLDALYDEHEVSCKWPLIEEGNIEAVLQTVYLPHVDLVVRQIRALENAASRLERAAPSEVTGELVEGYRQAARLMESGLRAQILVCETDFGDASCRPYNEAVENALGAATTTTADSAPDAQEEQ